MNTTTCYWCSHDFPDEEMTPNCVNGEGELCPRCMRKAGAAPDMLEALESLTAAINEKDLDALVVFVSVEKAYAAIAKATGSNQ